MFSSNLKINARNLAYTSWAVNLISMIVIVLFPFYGVAVPAAIISGLMYVAMISLVVALLSVAVFCCAGTKQDTQIDTISGKGLEHGFNSNELPEKHETQKKTLILESPTLSFFSGFLCSKKEIKSTFAAELDEASSRYSEQEENEMLDLETIDIAIKAFKQESEFFIGNSPEQKEIQRSIFKPATENTALIGPRDNGCCDQLMSELRFLMKTYPKASSGRATIENLESDALASRVHHEKVLSIAEILLPNLSSLLNEARLIKNRLSVGAQC